MLNTMQSNIVIVRRKQDSNCHFLTSLSGTVPKYWGHYITDDLSDDRDIHRQGRVMYAQTNMLICTFSMYCVSVKTTVVRACCTMYTACLWWRYRKSSVQRLSVECNDGLRLLLYMFVSDEVPTCSAVLLMYRCMCRLLDSVISTLMNLHWVQSGSFLVCGTIGVLNMWYCGFCLLVCFVIVFLILSFLLFLLWYGLCVCP